MIFTVRSMQVMTTASAYNTAATVYVYYILGLGILVEIVCIYNKLKAVT